MSYNIENTDSNLFCRFCNKECKNLNSLAQHELCCKFNPNKLNTDKAHLDKINSNGNFQCKYCLREFKHFNNLKAHEVYCQANQNHINS